MDITTGRLMVLNNQGKILVVHRNDKVPSPNMWGIPGGVVKEGQSPRHAAREKTTQEAGLEFKDKDLSYFGKFRYPVEENKLTCWVWIVRFHGEDEEVKLNKDGHDMYMWESPEKLFGRDDLMTGMYLILDRWLGGR